MSSEYNMRGDQSQQPLPELIESALDVDPIKQFQRWFTEAAAAKLPEPEAMTLATASTAGVPSARMVLLKVVDARGFVFFSNYLSRKGKELEENPLAALVFFWEGHGRQVRVEGSVERISAEASDEYFRTRGRENQLSALASAQSQEVTREELDRRFEELRRAYENRQVPRPPQWGGYVLRPARIEFWQRRFARLNDRVLYTLQKNETWSMKRLAP